MINTNEYMKETEKDPERERDKARDRQTESCGINKCHT